jgi:fermentation-respiration switch protein FrsA (DUF1100 family)
LAQSKRLGVWHKVVIGLLTPIFLAGALTTGVAQLLAFLAVHPPRERFLRNPADLGLPFENVQFTTSDGIELVGWFIGSPQGEAAVILGHGFSRSRQEMLDVAAMLHNNCYNVLLFDWRAHGKSGGKRTTFGHKEVEDLAAAVRYVASRPEVDPERIGVLGNSMGAAIAIRAAAILPQLKAVVSDSPFTSLEDSIEVGVRRRGPLGVWPLRPLAQFFGLKTIGIDPDLVRPIDDIDDISPRPVLIMHGGRDELIPEDAGARLYAAASEPKMLWYAPDAAHVELAAEYPDEYEAKVVAFLDAALKGQQAASCAVPAAAEGKPGQRDAAREPLAD